MPIITAIKPQKNKKRVNIYLDGKYSFGLDIENLFKFKLKVEQELSNKEVSKIVKKAEFNKTYEKLLKFSTLRPRSKKEIERWLKKHKIHETLHDNLFNRLKKLKLINEEQFAKWWVDQRMEFKPRGKYALRSELLTKGVDRKIIDNVLNQVDLNETKIAKELLIKKKYRWDKLAKLEKRKKMSQFLARKGISWESIKEAIDDILENQ